MRATFVTWLAALAASAALIVSAPPAAAARHAPAPVVTDTLALTLQGAIASALARNTDMRAANAGVDVAHGQITTAESEALPQVNASLNYTRTFASIYSGAASAGDSLLGPIFRNTPFAAENQWSFDITGSQMLFSRRVGSALAAAHEYRKGTEALREQTASDVTLAVTQAYYNAVAAAELRRIAQAGLEQARAQMAQVASFHQQGTRAEYDLVQAEVDARNAEPPVITTENAYTYALLELKRVIGMPYEQAVALTTPVRLDDAAVPVMNEAALPAPQRAALVAAEAEVQGRRKLVDVERAGRWPELKLIAHVSQQAFPTDQAVPAFTDFGHSVTAGAQIDFPLFLGFKTSGAIQRATGELEQAAARREATRRQIDLELDRSRQEVARTLAVFMARHGTIDLAERAHHLATVRYSNGLSTQLEVSDARLQMLTAQGNAVIAARDYRIALAQLEHALGVTVPVTPKSIDQISLTLDAAGTPSTAEAAR